MVYRGGGGGGGPDGWLAGWTELHTLQFHLSVKTTNVCKIDV